MRQCSVLLSMLLVLCFVHSARAQTPIPENAHRDIGGAGWECNRGHRQAGNACAVVEVPANARLEPLLGHTWECNRGYRQAGNVCVAVEVPANARLEPLLGHAWESNRGYRQAGNACAMLEVPADARVEPFLGHTWECNRGYLQAGNACVAVGIPTNARVEPFLGHTWECNRGYRQAGNACVAVEVPANARLEPLFGHTWECDSGFRIQAFSCVRMTAVETVAVHQAMQSAAQRIEQVRLRESGVDWSDCGDAIDRLGRAARDMADRAPDSVSAKDELNSCQGESNCRNSRSQYESILSEMRDLLDTVQARFRSSQSSCGR